MYLLDTILVVFNMFTNKTKCKPLAMYHTASMLMMSASSVDSLCKACAV